MNELLYAMIAVPAGGGGEGGGGIVSLLIPFALVFGIMYFLVIRPQQKRQKEQDSFLTSLKVGDLVVTQGGIFGKITGVSEASLTLEISDRVRIRVLRSAVVSRQESALAEATATTGKSSGKKDSKKDGADAKSEESSEKDS